MLSWLFKYAYVLLEHVANGFLEPPTVSLEMLSPVEQRPAIQLAWCIAVYLLIGMLGGLAGTALGIALLAWLPASVAVLGLGLGAFQSVNPLALWRIVRGLGWRYAGILGLMLAAFGFVALMQMAGAWTFVTIAASQLAVLTVFCALGGALFERRLEIGHEPMHSPERRREQESREHTREIGAMLDEVYTLVRIGRRSPALEPIRQWLRKHRERRELPVGPGASVEERLIASAPSGRTSPRLPETRT